MKRLLTLNDLYNYYSSTKKSTHFNASKDADNIVVQIDGILNFKKSEKDTEGLREVYLQACHIDENINGSNIKESVMTAALPSFSNRPILGYIHEVDGQFEFYGHNMHLDEEGNVVYDEIPIGIIPESCDAKLVYDKDKNKTYVEVKGYIFEEYSKASEILEREQECSVSVELSIRELSYDAKNKYLDIEDFFFSGVTILGKTDYGEVVKPGMTGSNIKLADFSEQNNSMFSKSDKLVEVLEKLNTTLSNFQIDNNQERKEEFEVGNEEIFEEVTEEVAETTEEVVAEVTEEVTEESTEEVVATEEESEETTEETPEVVEEESVATSESEVVEESAEENTEEFSEIETVETEVQFEEKLVRTYEISHEDIRYALYNLLAAYESADNEWYFINAVYDNYFTYENWDGDKIYGQSYAKDGDNISFDGERWNLHRELLTDQEYAELMAMRSNYEALVQFKADAENAELRAQKEAILYDAKYSVIAEKDENSEYKNASFAKLVSEMDNYSLTDLEKELKSVFADYITNGGQFAYVGEEKPVVSKKMFATSTGKKSSRYGNLFNK